MRRGGGGVARWGGQEVAWHVGMFRQVTLYLPNTGDVYR